MGLRRNKLEKFSERQRDISDRRKFVAKAVFSYIGDDGHEYRKAFTAPVGTHESKFWDFAPHYIHQ